MPDRVYLDWNATTPLRPEARAGDGGGVGSAAATLPRSMPRAARPAGWSRTRGPRSPARSARCRATSIFTSGGTEANALALTPGLRGAVRASRSRGCWCRRSSTPRCSRADGFRRGRSAGRRHARRRWSISTICARLLASGPPALVSVMLANNETGAVQPVAEAAEIVHAAGGLLHVDAIQAFGKIPFDINAIGADLVTLSAHKIGGPKGVGALVLAEGLAGLGAAAARRRSGAGAPGGNRECRGNCRLWRRREGRHGGAGKRRHPPRSLAKPAGKRPAADPGRHRVLRPMRRGCPIPRCLRLPA